MSNDQTRVMQCMEIWGGNQPVSSGVSMTGVDAWIYSRPFGEAAGGGDVHYVSSCATGRITRLLLADVSGHGQHVAHTAARLRDLMRRYVNYLDQTRFVGEMNREFLGLSSSGNFATAIVATVFAPTNDLTLCNAGHPPPLWYQASTGQWGFLEHKTSPRNNPSNIPLGVLDLADYEQFGTQLWVGDWVVC